MDFGRFFGSVLVLGFLGSVFWFWALGGPLRLALGAFWDGFLLAFIDGFPFALDNEHYYY